jgi:hypothetical protein
MNERDALSRNNVFFVGGVCMAIVAIDSVQSVAPDWRSSVEIALSVVGIIAILMGKRITLRGEPS